MTAVTQRSSMKARAAGASRTWHLVLAAVVAASLITQIVLLGQDRGDVNANVAEHVSLGISFVRLFSYFTIQSNLIVLAVAVTLVLNPERNGRFWRIMRLDGMLGIVITGLVFGFILAGQVDNYGIGVWVNAGFHYFSPWWTLVGWLLLGPRPRITKWSTVAWAFAWPVVWIAYTLIHGAITNWYPYPFLDAHTRGYAVALRNTLLVVIIGLALAAIFKLLDQKLPRPSKP